jgi:hypothetical protein
LKNKSNILILILSIVWISCEKELNITDFSDDFGNYQPELKVEGLLQQDKPENSIVRIIRTSSITNPDLYNEKDDDGDGDVDEEDEILMFVQDSSATVNVTNLESGETIDFQYVAVADSTLRFEEDDEGNESRLIVPYGGYKPKTNGFQIETYAQYEIDIYSREFDKTITGLTTVYPKVEFIDTLYTFQNNIVTMNVADSKEIFWKSDLNVTAYYITFEEMERINATESEFLISYMTTRDNELTEEYSSASIGRTVIGVSSSTIIKLTVEALSPEYGRYILSELPFKDPLRSNLRDEDGSPVMGSFGAVAANSLFVVIEE